MTISLPNFVNNRSEEIHEIKCKYGHVSKSCEISELNIGIVTAFLNKQTLKII